jgi:hypothetical protein
MSATTTATATPTPTPGVPASTFEEHRSLILGCTVLGCILIYHLALYLVLKNTPQATVMGVNRATRRIWASTLMQPKESAYHAQHIIAVHTLRNWNMSNTMMASARLVGLVQERRKEDRRED